MEKEREIVLRHGFFFIDFENYINVAEHFLQKFLKKISAF